MIGVFTGISGLNKRDYIENIASELRERGRHVEIFHVGDEIIAAARKGGFRVTTDRILDLPAGALVGFRQAVFERILAAIARQNASDSLLLINTHACFKWKDALTAAFDVHYLAELNERARKGERDMAFFCLIDDIPAVHKGLNSTSQWHSKLTLTEVATWQDEERFTTSVLAQVLETEFFLIAKSEPLQNAVDLLSQPTIAKFYFSFPITAIEEERRAEWSDKVSAFRDELRKNVLVFDPLAIKDLMWMKGQISQDVAIPENEKEALHRVLERHTVSRDLQFIDQSDGVVVFLPEAAAHSPGVQREIEHGHDTGKDVLVFLAGSASPFLKYSATQIFDNEEELKSYVDENFELRGSSS